MINNQFSSTNNQNNNQQQLYYSNYPPNSFITNLFCSSVQPKIQNLFDQPISHPQKAGNQVDFNDSWDDLAYKQYQNKTNIEQNDSQFFNIFAPCNQQNQQMNNVPYNQQQLPVIFTPYDKVTNYQPVKRFKQQNCKQSNSPYTPQKNNHQQNHQKSSKKWMSGSINSTPQTAACSSMKEEFLSNSNSSMLNQPDISEFNYSLSEPNAKQQHIQSKINCCISASCSSKSSNYNSDSEESCFLSTNTHVSSTSQANSNNNNKVIRKVHIRNAIDEIWNRSYDGSFIKQHFIAF